MGCGCNPLGGGTSGGGASKVTLFDLNSGPSIPGGGSNTSSAKSIPNTLASASDILLVTLQCNIQVDPGAALPGFVDVEVDVEYSADAEGSFNSFNSGVGRAKFEAIAIPTTFLVIYQAKLVGPLPSTDGLLWFHAVISSVNGGNLTIVPGELDISIVQGVAF